MIERATHSSNDAAVETALVPLVQQFLARAQQAPDALAFAVYPAGAGNGRRAASITWGEWADASRAAAAQLLLSGIARGERIAVMSGNRPLWPIVDLAMQMIGAIGVGISTTSTAAQVARLLSDAGATLIFVAGAANARTVHEAQRRRGVRIPVIADSPADGTRTDVEVLPPTVDATSEPVDTPWPSWLRDGAAHLHANAALRADLQARIDAVALDDVSALIYTSGSTGIPKGACISHRYLAASAASIVSVLPLTADDRTLSFLPFSHAAERVFGECTRIATGVPTALIEDPTDVFPVARDFEPTLFGGLPRIFERLYEAAEVARQEATDPRAAIAERIGARCRAATSGGATMPSEIAKDLASLGLVILGAYGQTEHLCIAMNRPSHYRFDTVGLPMPGTTIRVADDGELLVAKSALTFSGYWADPIATRAAFTDDGLWLRTGDRATVDADGMLRIIGRVKELIALSTGRKIAPIPIEAALVSSPFIAHAVCYGEGRKYLTALFSLRRAVIEGWARGEGIAIPWPDVLTHPRIREQLQAVVDRVNATLARPDRIQRFAVTEHEFTIDGGELTSTHKVMRREVVARYAALLDAVYGESVA